MSLICFLLVIDYLLYVIFKPYAMMKMFIQSMFIIELLSVIGIKAQFVVADSLNTGLPFMFDGIQASDSTSFPILKSESVVVPPSLINLVINEIDSDSEGVDHMDFIELYDGGVGNTSLNEVCVVFFNGTDPVKSSYSKILKDCKTNEEGYFIFGNSNVAGVGMTFPNTKLQNGPDAVAIYYWPSSTRYADDISVSFDNLLDGIVYVTNSTDVASGDLLSLLNRGQAQVNEAMSGSSGSYSLQRFPNGSGGVRNSSCFIALSPTPGTTNANNISNVELELGSCDFSIVGDNIVFNVGVLPYSVTIIDLSGRVFLKTDISESGVLDLSFLKKGLYLVQFNDRVEKLLKY